MQVLCILREGICPRGGSPRGSRPWNERHPEAELPDPSTQPVCDLWPQQRTPRGWFLLPQFLRTLFMASKSCLPPLELGHVPRPQEAA